MTYRQLHPQAHLVWVSAPKAGNPELITQPTQLYSLDSVLFSQLSWFLLLPRSSQQILQRICAWIGKADSGQFQGLPDVVELFTLDGMKYPTSP